MAGRMMAIAAAAALTLAACGDRGEEAPDPAAQAGRGIIGQAALFCPSQDFSWETFDAAARTLGAGPDEGEVRRPPTIIGKETVRERWVALTQSGRRTTVWIGEMGPGRRYLNGTAAVDHVSGLVCMVHDPGLTREEARDLTKPWEGAEISGAARTGPGKNDLEARSWTLVQSSPGMGLYQDIQMYVPSPEHGGGAMLIRHRFDYGSATP